MAAEAAFWLEEGKDPEAQPPSKSRQQKKIGRKENRCPGLNRRPGPNGRLPLRKIARSFLK